MTCRFPVGTRSGGTYGRMVWCDMHVNSTSQWVASTIPSALTTGIPAPSKKSDFFSPVEGTVFGAKWAAGVDQACRPATACGPSPSESNCSQSTEWDADWQDSVVYVAEVRGHKRLKRAVDCIGATVPWSMALSTRISRFLR